jgi:hypothetical protein
MFFGLLATSVHFTLPLDERSLPIISSHDIFMADEPDHTLEFLIAFDGRIHHLEEGYWLKFDIKRVRTTKRRPHGLSYSFTLHAPDGTRLIGFDNAHSVAVAGSRFKQRAQTTDHWHRAQGDIGTHYEFKDAETLLDDFFDEVERVLRERGIGMAVIAVEEARRSK